MPESSVALALRLLGMGAFVFLGVGSAFLARARITPRWHEWLVYAFTVSYAWLFGLSIVLPVLGWTVDHAMVLTVALVVVLLPWRRLAIAVGPLQTPLNSLPELTLFGVVIAFAAAAWFIEPTIHGDAALDLISVSRFADGGAIRFDNTSVLPSTRATYIFQPYQLALGMVARWSDVDTIVTFQKIRPLLVLLSLTFVYAVIARLVPARAHAVAAFAVVLAFVGLDLVTWENVSLFPVVHRGGAAAGLCVPALMVLVLAATRRVDDPSESRRVRLALVVAPVFLLASVCTHALEMYTLMCFVAAVGIVILIGVDPAGDRRQVLKLAASFVLVLAIYLPVHRLALPELLAFETELKSRLATEFQTQYPDIRAMLTGDMGQEADDLLRGRIPATTAGIIGIPALAAAVWLVPASAAILVLAIVPLALVFASPAGYVGLALATSADSVQEAMAYFGLLGLLALAIGIAAIAHGIVTLATRSRSRLGPTAALVVLIAVGVAVWNGWARVAAQDVLDLTRAYPRVFFLLSAVLAGGVLWVAWRRRRYVADWPGLPAVAVCLAALIAIPLAGAGVPPDERVNLIEGVRRARIAPSILDWNAYYDVLRETINPPLPVPRVIVDELRRRLPPRQVLLAHPRYSCSLAVVVNAYCVNPEVIYGQYYLTARGYQNDYVYTIDGVDADWHPFFNTLWPVEDRERSFLQTYSVDYLLADPTHADLIARKLAALNVPAALEWSGEGYMLYKLVDQSRLLE